MCRVVPANLRKIERGETQPGIILAIRLVQAMGEPVGPFFRNLAEQAGIPLFIPPGSTDKKHGLSEMPCWHRELSNPRVFFGIWIKETRLAHGVSQRILAESACYHLRNMLEVESGRREPGVMTALTMVCATGCDVVYFFDTLAEAVAASSNSK